MPEKLAEKERELLYKHYQQERLIAEEDLNLKNNDLNQLKQQRESLSIEFIKLNPPIINDNKTGQPITINRLLKSGSVSTWLIAFDRSKECKDLEDCLMLKSDWGAIRVACGVADASAAQPGQPVTGQLQPWVGRGKVPDGSKAGIYMYMHICCCIYYLHTPYYYYYNTYYHILYYILYTIYNIPTLRHP